MMWLNSSSQMQYVSQTFKFLQCVSVYPQVLYLLFLLILPSHCDLMIRSWTVNHSVRQRSAHTSHSLTVLGTFYTFSSYVTSPCFSSQNIMSPPCVVPSISSVTWTQQWLYSINKNTSCVMLHAALQAREHRHVGLCVCLHKATRCLRVHIPSVAICRKCCSATARTDDFKEAASYPCDSATIRLWVTGFL